MAPTTVRSQVTGFVILTLAYGVMLYYYVFVMWPRAVSNFSHSTRCHGDPFKPPADETTGWTFDFSGCLEHVDIDKQQLAIIMMWIGFLVILLVTGMMVAARCHKYLYEDPYQLARKARLAWWALVLSEAQPTVAEVK